MKEIIAQNEIMAQNIVQQAVFSATANESDVSIYNRILPYLEIHDMEDTLRILELIQLNMRVKYHRP